MREISLGLLELHNYGIVHGNIKPENVILFGKLCGTINAKLADYGSFSHTFTSTFSSSEIPLESK